MRGNWPSLTAMAVAFGRGLGTSERDVDPQEWGGVAVGPW